MVEEYDEIADSQYTSERTEYLDEDYGEIISLNSCSQKTNDMGDNVYSTEQAL